MKILLVIFLGSLTSAFAADSDWKLCKGDAVLYEKNVKLVVNSFEHRSKNGRATDLTFIYGGNILRGSLNTTESNSGAIKLKGDNTSFKGTVVIDYETATLALIGKLILNKSSSELNVNLECETLLN